MDLTSFLDNLPVEPGIYCMLDADKKIIYVGKAKSLKNRVRSYFTGKKSGKTRVLVASITEVKVTVTQSETEALLLESNLIKQHKPKYNIILRDDKSYPYIRISKGEFPSIALYRGKRLSSNEGRLYGPYPNVQSAKETLFILQKLFKLRTCRDSFFANRSRPCLEYQINRCSGPCTALIDKDAYLKDIREAAIFLSGERKKLLIEFDKAMNKASQAMAFEEAAKIRDKINALKSVLDSQTISTQSKIDATILAAASEGQQGVICELEISLGQVIDTRYYTLKVPQTLDESGLFGANIKLLDHFVVQHYLLEGFKLPSLLVISSLSELTKSALLEHLPELKVNLGIKGKYKSWVNLASLNAKQTLERNINNKTKIQASLSLLQQWLGMSHIIHRIECFDISHTVGEQTVASCVVYDSTGHNHKAYRRFNIKGITPGDDYAAMAQVLERRARFYLENPEIRPALILIDGGKGQLKRAIEVLNYHNLQAISLLGIVKGEGRKAEFDSILCSDLKTYLKLDADDKIFHLLQSIRDEAHRFAITGHRKKRAIESHKNRLDDIDGIGTRKKMALLAQFGSMAAIRKATINDISNVPGIGMALAQKIKDELCN